MDDDRWAPVVRLQEMHRAARDQATLNVIDAAITREVNAIAKERAAIGTLATMRDNLRLLDRQRSRLERLRTPLMAAANDPWPEVDRRIDRDRTFRALKPETRATLDLIVRGLTYAEAAAIMKEPVGTLKSRVSRAKAKAG